MIQKPPGACTASTAGGSYTRRWPAPPAGLRQPGPAASRPSGASRCARSRRRRRDAAVGRRLNSECSRAFWSLPVVAFRWRANAQGRDCLTVARPAGRALRAALCAGPSLSSRAARPAQVRRLQLQQIRDAQQGRHGQDEERSIERRSLSLSRRASSSRESVRPSRSTARSGGTFDASSASPPI